MRSKTGILISPEGAAIAGMRPLEIRRLGSVPYADALTLQRELVEDRRAGRIGDVLLLLEHPPVLTLGVRGDGGRGHIRATKEELAARGIEVFEAGRGGDITYHGPGQIVGYPIVDLKPDRCDVHRYIRDLEEVLIRTAAAFGQRFGGAQDVGPLATPAHADRDDVWMFEKHQHVGHTTGVARRNQVLLQSEGHLVWHDAQPAHFERLVSHPGSSVTLVPSP